MADPFAELPAAVPAVERRGTFRLIWLVPIVALLVGGWLALRTVLDQGPTVTITFATGEGLEAGKTKIKLKEVEIGVVRTIALSEDRSGVVVSADLTKQAADLLVEDTRFWVVRPRIASGGVSGLGTLLSGAYIGVDVGKATAARRAFKGLEEPPILTAGVPGREFLLKADDLASVGYGTPVYFRRLQVGEVTAYELDKNGKGVTIRVFVYAPYERFVTLGTRFWQASGIDVALDATGIRVNTESIAALLAGGIAFGAPPEAPTSIAAPAEAEFRLHRTRLDALKREDLRVESYVLVFRESVRGLQVGAPVDFRGIVAGEVASIGVDFDGKTKQVTVPVEIRFFPDRLRSHQSDQSAVSALPEARRRRELDALVGAGFRAQLRTGNLLTGQLYVALDFFPTAPKSAVDWSKSPPELPTNPGGLQELQTTITSIATKLDRIPYAEIVGGLQDLQTTIASVAAKLDRVPYEEVAGDLRAVLKDVNMLVKRLEGDLAPEMKTTLEEARRTIASAERVLATDAPLQQELRDALREVARAAQSVRALTQMLERQPEALIRGRRETP